VGGFFASKFSTSRPLPWPGEAVDPNLGMRTVRAPERPAPVGMHWMLEGYDAYRDMEAGEDIGCHVE
jgi:hypothetical protein